MPLNPKNHDGLIERLYWLVRLRWIAAAGVLLTVFIAVHLLELALPGPRLYATAATLAVYNGALLLFLKIYGNRQPFAFINRVANIQIALDLLSLTVLIHFSGGIENPFIFYFIFHIIIASILLSRPASFMQATIAVLLFGALVAAEYSGVLSHYCLSRYFGHDQRCNNIYILAVSFVFVSTLYIAVYMATSISKKLRQRENALAETNLLLQEKDRMKSEYVLRVTHGIKEHLSAIEGCLEPVADGIVGQLNPGQLDLVSRAVRRTEKLTLFVKALLQITRIKLSQDVRMEPFVLADCVSEAVSAAAVQALAKNISVTVDGDAGVDKIRGARDYIQETLTNLLVNAVKYTPAGGKVLVKLVDKGAQVLIEIADSGIGIPAADLPKLFEEFFRASNAKKIERDGTGLGLSIAKRVVEMHGGRIWVESQEGLGSRFYVELPK